HKASQHMLSKVEEIAPVLTKEQGKTLLESRLEARRFGENIGWFADLADKIHGQHVRLPDLTTYGLVVRRPIGVCGAIVPWNFPLTLAANKVAPAIAAGNTVVLKPATTTPLATLACIEALMEGGLPCPSTERLLGQEGAYDALMEKLVARAAKLKPGNGLDKDSRMGPMHTETQRTEVEAQIKDAIDRGAKVVYGGGRPKGAEYEKGWFIDATILENVPDGARMWTEEVFGPALPVRKVKYLDEALRLANDTPYGLGSSIWTSNMAAARRAVDELEAGYTWVNAVVIAHDELPFGGTKQSGF